jgi:hypothetical protein
LKTASRPTVHLSRSGGTDYVWFRSVFPSPYAFRTDHPNPVPMTAAGAFAFYSSEQLCSEPQTSRMAGLNEPLYGAPCTGITMKQWFECDQGWRLSPVRTCARWLAMLPPALKRQGASSDQTQTIALLKTQTAIRLCRGGRFTGLVS